MSQKIDYMGSWDIRCPGKSIISVPVFVAVYSLQVGEKAVNKYR